MKKLNYLLTSIIAIVLMFGLCLGLINSHIQKVHATELANLAGSELTIKTTKSKEVCEVSFASGRYLHLDPAENQTVVDNNSAGADMEYYNGVLKFYDNNDVHTFYYDNIGIYATNESDKKLTIMVSDNIFLDALDFTRGDLIITTPADVEEEVVLDVFHRVAVSGTLTVSGYAKFSAYYSTGWNDTINGDKNAVITADKLEVLDNAGLSGYTAKDVDKYAIKVNYLTLDTAGEMYVYARTSGFTQALRVESDDIDLVNFKRLYICAKTSFKSNLTNVPELLDAADGQVHGDIYGTTTQKDGEYILEIVPSSALCKVSFNANGGNGSMATVNNVYYNYKIPSCSFTAPENKKFRCWAINSPDGAKTYVGANYNITEDITLYPVWMDLVATSGDIKIGSVFGAPANGTCSYNQDSGVLTIRGDFNTDISIDGSETDRSNIIIAFDGNHAYGHTDASRNNLLIQNNWGDITLVNNGEEKVTVYLAAITTNFSLIIQGNLEVILTGIDWVYHATWRPTHPELGFIYAKEKLSILGKASLKAIDPFIPSNVQNNSAIVAAGMIEIDTTGEVEIGTKTLKYSTNYNANICIVDGTSTNVKDRLMIRQCGTDGYLKLYRYNSNDYFNYTYIETGTANLSHRDCYSYLRYYENTTTPSTNVTLLSIKPYTVTFDNNGGTGSMNRVYLNEPGEITLPECSFTAPEGCHFGGWTIGPSAAMQPGETYTIYDSQESITVRPIWMRYIDSVLIVALVDSVQAGNLLPFEMETMTKHLTIKEFGTWTCWVYWSETDSAWLEFEGDPVAVADGTHYGVRIACDLDDGYEFNDNYSLVLNGVHLENVGHNFIEKRLFYDYVFIDLGEVPSTSGEENNNPEENSKSQENNNPEEEPAVGATQAQPEPKGLSAGAIVLIVIGSVIVLGAGGFAIYWFVIKKKTWADFTKIFKKK